ncbi:MAG: hypothetical protein Q9N34_03100 [Aquificota bacterium]|nr:hypothetical protein [Aquificota bacterium]
MKLVEGTGECVEFEGKKWLASIKGWMKGEKDVRGWDLSKDWSVEFTLHVKNGNEPVNQEIDVFIGNWRSPLSLIYRADGFFSVNGKRLPKVRTNGQTHTVGLMKRGDTIHVFLDGERWGTVPADSVALSRLKGKILIRLGPGDIERGSYAFITGIKVSQFSK